MTAVFCPSKYNGSFRTLHYCEIVGWQVTYWAFGEPYGHNHHQELMPALLEILQAGFNWANPKMQNVFENDVILAGE